MEDKLDRIIAKLSKLQQDMEQLRETVEAHRVEHGFAKMQDGGINQQFGDGQQGMGGMPGGGGMGGMPGMGGMGGMPGMGGMTGPDPSRPPGM